MTWNWGLPLHKNKITGALENKGTPYFLVMRLYWGLWVRPWRYRTARNMAAPPSPGSDFMGSRCGALWLFTPVRSHLCKGASQPFQCLWLPSHSNQSGSSRP